MITICIIVKNDSVNLKKCLELLQSTGYEIVVVDTGSTDETIAIAKQYTNQVYHFTWCNDFSAARNYAISKVKSPYVLMVDSDEMLMEINPKDLERKVKKNPKDIGRIHRHNSFVRNGNSYLEKELVNRLFPKDEYHYEGIIHEQLVANDGKVASTYEIPIVFLHEGYNGTWEQRQAKAERNIHLLNQMLLDHKEDTYILYQLGKSFYFKECYKEAADYFEEAFQYDLNPKLEYVIDMIEMYGYALINSKQYEKALGFENLYEEFGNTSDFVFLMGLIYEENGMFDQAVQQFLHATQFEESRVVGVNSYLALYNVGVIYECLGFKEEAKKYYEECGSYAKAIEGIERCS